jgi:hypothetical protein
LRAKVMPLSESRWRPLPSGDWQPE